MTGAEIATLLTHVSAFDSRTVTEDRVAAWRAAVDGRVTYRDAVEAVTAHYGKTAEWIMPAHVNAWALRERAARLRDAGTNSDPDALPEETPETYNDRLRARRREIADGTYVPERDRELPAARPMPQLTAGLGSVAATLGPVRAELARRKAEREREEAADADRLRVLTGVTEPEPVPDAE